jgi:hypothetical protein
VIADSRLVWLVGRLCGLDRRPTLSRRRQEMGNPALLRGARCDFCIGVVADNKTRRPSAATLSEGVMKMGGKPISFCDGREHDELDLYHAPRGKDRSTYSS